MKTKKPFLIFYLLITLLLIADVIAMYKLKISLAGYWSDRILFGIWVLGTLVLLTAFLKKYLSKFSLVLLILGLTLTLPFWIILFETTALGGSDKAKSPDGKFRVELIGDFLKRPGLQIIENRGILEKVIDESDTEFLRNNDLKIGYETISDVKFSKVTPDSITLEVRTPWRLNLVSFKRKK